MSPFSRCVSTDKSGSPQRAASASSRSLASTVLKIELLREGAQAVLVNDLPAIGFDGEVDDLCLQVERLFGFDATTLRELLARGSKPNSDS